MERKARLEDGFASMRPIVSLSLFYVLFLSMESLLDERAATFLPPDAVAFAESVAAAASLVGFLLYALVRMRVPGFASLIYASGTLSAVGLLATSLVPGALSLLASGLATMLFVGFAGAAAHEALARRFADGPEIARAVGGAYAAGIVVQCLLMVVAPTPVVLALLLAPPCRRHARPSRALPRGGRCRPGGASRTQRPRPSRAGSGTSRLAHSAHDLRVLYGGRQPHQRAGGRLGRPGRLDQALPGNICPGCRRGHGPP